MMSSRFASDEMGHNPQAPGPAKKQAHSCWRKTLEEITTCINRRFYRSLRKTWELLSNDRCLFGLQNQWIFRTWFVDKKNSAMLVRMTEFRMRDSLHHVQGNDLGAGWIDHHTDLLLLFVFARWDGKSEWLTYSGETTIKTLFEP